MGASRLGVNAAGDRSGTLARPLFPLRSPAAHVRKVEAHDDVTGKDPEAERDRGELRLGNREDRFVEARFLEGADVAGPAPIGGDEGANEASERTGQGEDGAGE